MEGMLTVPHEDPPGGELSLEQLVPHPSPPAPTEEDSDIVTRNWALLNGDGSGWGNGVSRAAASDPVGC